MLGENMWFYPCPIIGLLACEKSGMDCLMTITGSYSPDWTLWGEQEQWEERRNCNIQGKTYSIYFGWTKELLGKTVCLLWWYRSGFFGQNRICG